MRLPFRDPTIRLSGVILAPDVEGALSRYYYRRPAADMVLDLSEVEYIDVAALTVIAATLVARADAGKRSSLRLPRSKGVRDFLRAWRFPEALEQITGRPISALLPGTDLQYLDEPQDTYTGIGDGVAALEYNPDWSGDQRTRRNFFEFYVFQEESGSPIAPLGGMLAAPRTESHRWTSALIKQVLSTHLGGDAAKDEVARVIVFEALSNAVRHPQANKILVVSKLERAGYSTREPKSLRLVVWDNGASIAATLSKPLAAGLRVRALQLEPWQAERILVRIQSFDKKRHRELTVDQSEDPTIGTSEPKLLLSSLFPGVSRTVAEVVPNVDPFHDHAPPPQWAYNSPGMGLYALTRTVLDQFQGSLVIRSGGYRLSMQIAHDAYRVKFRVRYKCKITEYPKWYVPFLGNLITINLPLV